MIKWYQRLCCKLTKHKYRKCYAWCDYSDIGDPIEYYYKCKICGYHFWNYAPPKEE